MSAIKAQKNNFKQVTWFFANDNIHPRSEYLERQRALKKVFNEVKQETQISLSISSYQPRNYYQAIQEVRDNKDKEQRCPHCWSLRLEQSFQFALDNGSSHVSSTLLSSKYQHLNLINRIGENLAKKYALNWFSPEHIPVELKTKGFYKQNYCGCAFSLIERMTNKYLIE